MQETEIILNWKDQDSILYPVIGTLSKKNQMLKKKWIKKCENGRIQN